MAEINKFQARKASGHGYEIIPSFPISVVIAKAPPYPTPHLPLFSEVLGISLVGVELDAGLTNRDEVHVPPSEDGQRYGHTEADEEHHYHEHALRVGGLGTFSCQ